MKIQNILVSLSIIFTVQLGLGHPMDADIVEAIPRGSWINLLSPINILPHEAFKSLKVRVREFDFECYMNVKESSLDDREIEPRAMSIGSTQDHNTIVRSEGGLAFTFVVVDKTVASIYCDLTAVTKGTGSYSGEYIYQDMKAVPGFGSIGLMKELLKQSFNIELHIAPPVKASLDDQLNAG